MIDHYCGITIVNGKFTSRSSWKGSCNFCPPSVKHVFTGLFVHKVNERGFEGVSDSWNGSVRLYICIKIESGEFDIMSNERK